MPNTNSPAPAPTAASFAHLLAALATPAPQPDPTWNDDDLAEDVASLSYERALRSHARYRAADPVEDASSALGDAIDAEVNDFPGEAAGQPSPRGRAVSPEAFARAHEAAQAELAQRQAEKTPSPFERNLKNASITIRMSKAECEQLHRRAAEAGLTVSAYLRSCTFEAEALRAQVKEVLAELRSASEVSKQRKREARMGQPGLFASIAAWFRHLFIPARQGQRVAQA
jgi:predicted DNA binding CopG/RHH family protein